MSKLIVARFHEQQETAAAVSALMAAGFVASEISSFYVTSPGQHDIFPLGGDSESSSGAKDAGEGAAAGAGAGGVVGGAVGALAIPIGGPAAVVGGALIGGYIGSLVGSFSEMKEKGESEADGEKQQPIRKAGMLVAVSASDSSRQASAINVLRQSGGHDLELANGHIEGGDWADFDPRVPPTFLRGR
ncbi:MAG: hypothetical protein ABIZ64_10765 [Casimicrobium sp.]|jgi:hypothetical protein